MIVIGNSYQFSHILRIPRAKEKGLGKDSYIILQRASSLDRPFSRAADATAVQADILLG